MCIESAAADEICVRFPLDICNLSFILGKTICIHFCNFPHFPPLENALEYGRMVVQRGEAAGQCVLMDAIEIAAEFPSNRYEKHSIN